MAVIVSDRLLTVGRGRDREGLMPAISGRDRDRQGSNPVSRPSAIRDLFQLVSRGNTGHIIHPRCRCAVSPLREKVATCINIA